MNAVDPAGSNRQRAARRCLFCGVEGLTLEDVIPMWVHRIIQKIAPSADGQYTLGQHFVSPGEPDVERVYSKAGPELVARVVCGACNNGWMGDIEAATLPVLGPLIRGETAEVDLSGQVQIAVWASLKVLLLDHVGTDHRPEASDYRTVMDRHEPVVHHRVRLGYRPDFADMPIDLLWANFAAGPKDTFDPDTGVNAFAYTLALGHAVVQVWGGQGLNAPADAQRSDRFPLSIWPIPTIPTLRWPPEVTVGATQDDLLDFNEQVLPTLTNPGFQRPSARALIDEVHRPT